MYVMYILIELIMCIVDIFRVHSASAVCPHNRVLPNMVSTCITAIYSASEELPANCSEAEFECYYTNHLRCYIVVLKNM